MPDKEMTMVERVAKAIYDVTSVDDVTLPWDRANAGQRELHMEWAAAAIEALREPTEAMVEVGTEARWQSAVRDANSVREIWAHMIDAALKEHEGA